MKKNWKSHTAVAVVVVACLGIIGYIYSDKNGPTTEKDCDGPATENDYGGGDYEELMGDPRLFSFIDSEGNDLLNPNRSGGLKISKIESFGKVEEVDLSHCVAYNPEDEETKFDTYLTEVGGRYVLHCDVAIDCSIEDGGKEGRTLHTIIWNDGTKDEIGGEVHCDNGVFNKYVTINGEIAEYNNDYIEVIK